FLVAEALEGLGRDQPVVDGALAHDREVGAVEAAFDAFLQPGALLGILDMHVFDADRARIGRAHASQDIAERERLLAEHGVDEDRSAEIGFGEAVMADLELGMRLRGLEAERIEVGLEMAAGAVVADELEARRESRIAPRAVATSIAPLALPLAGFFAACGSSTPITRVRCRPQLAPFSSL